MKLPAVVVLVLGSLHLVSPESHSLSVLATFISGETQFPEFVLVVKVNDVPVEYYDSDIKRIVSRRYWTSNNAIQETDLKEFVVEDFYSTLKKYSGLMMKHLNHTQGVHVFQEFVACDLEDDRLSRFFMLYAYDGKEKIKYDILTETHNSIVPEFIWSKFQMETNQLVSTKIYQPLCVRTLRRYLQEDKNVLLRKVHPRVRVMKKTLPDTGRTQVTCLATGFYPRHINMTLLRDGQPIPDQELTAGTLLPNEDGTYQLRRSFSISEEELRQRHQYTCRVTHLSVENKLDVNLEPEPGSDIVILWLVMIPVLIVSVLIITAIVRWRRRQIGSQNKCDVQYSAAQEECDASLSKSSTLTQSSGTAA